MNLGDTTYSKALIAVVVAAALTVVGCGAKDSGGSADNSKATTNVGDFRVGKYNYVDACQIFTAADLDAVTGKHSDQRQITGSYAEKTDSNDPNRVYTTTCARYEEIADLGPSSLNVFLDLYPNDRQKREENCPPNVPTAHSRRPSARTPASPTWACSPSAPITAEP
jgi:hypothetical protein